MTEVIGITIMLIFVLFATIVFILVLIGCQGPPYQIGEHRCWENGEVKTIWIVGKRMHTGYFKNEQFKTKKDAEYYVKNVLEVEPKFSIPGE